MKLPDRAKSKIKHLFYFAVDIFATCCKNIVIFVENIHKGISL